MKITNSCKNCTAKCCRGLAVVLTIPEAIRLIEATGSAPEQILEFSDNIDSRQTPHYPLLVKTSNGVEEWFIIIRRQEKDCIFLNEDFTCKIYKDRPHVCKLYPFELDGKKVKEGALCQVKFEREADTEEAAKRVADDLQVHGILARKWSATHCERPDIKKFCEYFGKER